MKSTNIIVSHSDIDLIKIAANDYVGIEVAVIEELPPREYLCQLKYYYDVDLFRFGWTVGFRKGIKYA